MSTASGEFDDGGNPAKSRAVSSAVDPSGLCVRAALGITTSFYLLVTPSFAKYARKRNSVQGGGYYLTRE